MVVSQDARTVGEYLFVQGDGLVQAARRFVGACEVVAGGEGVGVVVSQDARTVGEYLLVQGDGLVQAARRLVGVCEVVAGGKCVGVVGAQDCAKMLHGARERYSCLGGSELCCMPQNG